MIRQSGEKPEKTPPTAERLRRLLDDMGISVRDLLRKNVPAYEALGLADPKWSDEQIIDMMVEHPVLINRPIVVTPKGVKLCR